jgi:hypothetical protein
MFGVPRAAKIDHLNNFLVAENNKRYASYALLLTSA